MRSMHDARLNDGIFTKFNDDDVDCFFFCWFVLITSNKGSTDTTVNVCQ